MPSTRLCLVTTIPMLPAPRKLYNLQSEIGWFFYLLDFFFGGFVVLLDAIR